MIKKIIAVVIITSLLTITLSSCGAKNVRATTDENTEAIVKEQLTDEEPVTEVQTQEVTVEEQISEESVTEEEAKEVITEQQAPATEVVAKDSKEKQPVWHMPVYENRYIVDVAAYDEVVEEPVYEELSCYVCNDCGMKQFSNNQSTWSSHIEQHVLDYMKGYTSEAIGGWHVDTEKVQTGTTTKTIHHEEVGHTERVCVQEGYWE